MYFQCSNCSLYCNNQKMMTWLVDTTIKFMFRAIKSLLPQNATKSSKLNKQNTKQTNGREVCIVPKNLDVVLNTSIF